MRKNLDLDLNIEVQGTLSTQDARVHLGIVIIKVPFYSVVGFLDQFRVIGSVFILILESGLRMCPNFLI